MRHLFLRIFVPILTALMLAFAVGFVVADLFRSTIRPPSRDSSAARSSRIDLVRDQVMDMQDHLVRDDVESARALLSKLSKAGGVDVYALDEGGGDLLGRVVDGRFKAIMEDVDMERPRRFRRQGRFVRYHERVTSAAGRRFDILMEIDTRSWFSWRRLTILLIPFGSAAVALAIVSLLLARGLTSPVLKIRNAVRRFADGDLEQRISPAFGRRRDELAQLARDFDTMAERISALLTAQRRLLQDVSHELRSPLARQAVAIELVRGQFGEGHDSTSLDRVEREHGRLDDLVSELLTLTKLEGTPEAIERNPIPLIELIEEVVDDATFECSKRGVTVVLEQPVACDVFGVREVLRRAFENIVRNGVAYSGGEVVVSMALRNGDVVTRVVDHGPGVPENELHKVLTPFYRTSTARDRRSGGVGLGLAIADRAVRWHGGTITLHNTADEGLAVDVALPVATG
ncbi:MAG: ATP-binding protein [Phycisphaerae bacterium]